MRASLFSAALMVTFLGYAPPLFAGHAHDRVTAAEAKLLAEQGKILPMNVMVEKAEKLRTGRLLEAGLRLSRGRYLYDIEILDAGGVVWEMKFDAATGTLLRIEEEEE